LRDVWRLVADPKLSQTYFPESPRKGKPAILLDNLLWLIRNLEGNRYYFVYGLDRKGARPSRFIPYRRFRQLRDRLNRHVAAASEFDYVCLLRDKFVFSQFVSSLAIPTPKNLAICNSISVTWLDTSQQSPFAQLLDRGFEGDCFCKQVTGILGSGAFKLRLEAKRVFINDQQVTLEIVRQKLNGNYLIQEKLNQHPAMAELHPSSINTLRLVTARIDGEIKLLSAAQRIGANGKSVDNWAAGGIVVAVDRQEGTLGREGFFKPGYGGRVTRHPSTGVAFEGFQIPYFAQCLEIARQAHSQLYAIHSVGWDVAITAAGPVLIEGNDDWEGGIPMVLEEDFKPRFLAALKQSDHGESGRNSRGNAQSIGDASALPGSLA
jgi:hypothetical protein